MIDLSVILQHGDAYSCFPGSNLQARIFIQDKIMQYPLKNLNRSCQKAMTNGKS
jgi:hypothetical protein